MITVQIPTCELERVDELGHFKIMDSEQEIEFDNIVKIANLTSGMQIAYINFIDDKRHWLKSKIGVDVTEVAREIRDMCAYYFRFPTTLCRRYS